MGSWIEEAGKGMCEAATVPYHLLHMGLGFRKHMVERKRQREIYLIKQHRKWRNITLYPQGDCVTCGLRRNSTRDWLAGCVQMVHWRGCSGLDSLMLQTISVSFAGANFKGDSLCITQGKRIETWGQQKRLHEVVANEIWVIEQPFNVCSVTRTEVLERLLTPYIIMSLIGLFELATVTGITWM